METKHFNPKTVKPETIPERIIQPKLEVNPPNDKFEQEADHVADKVSRMPGNATDNLQMQPKEDEEKKLQMKPEEEESISMKPEVEGNIIQMSSYNAGGQNVPEVSSELASRLQLTKGRGNPLSENVNREMGQKIGGEFNNVRIHTDSNAIQMNKELGAKAFTHGNDIYFNNGQYNPSNSSGKSLLAHELTHTIQQGGSPALALRRKLQRKDLSIQRAATSHYGDFNDESYKTLKDGTGKEIGVEMYMKFKPNKNVNATLIGMTQSVRSVINGSAVAINNDPVIKSRMISAANAKPNSSPVLGTDEGIQIDQLSSYRSPLYTVGAVDAKDKLLSQGNTPSPVSKLKAPDTHGELYSGWGVHGYRYMAGKTLKEKNAELHDTPMLGNRGNNAEQLFETTALAISGVQNGTYYGSVQWGWRTDAKGKFTQIPFTLISMGTPSSTFLKSAEIWNTGKNTANESNIALPMEDVQLTKAPGVWLVTNPYQYETTRVHFLPQNTRVVVTDKGMKSGFNNCADLYKWWKIRIVDGPYTAETGWVMQHFLKDERA
jgi:hypothetical protein